MGYADGDLILPAILYMNPGKTREEISELMDRVKASPVYTFKDYDPWGIYEGGDFDLHRGLEGLASLLWLGKSKEFKRFTGPKKDENGLEIEPPEYTIEYDTLEARIIVHEGNIIKKPKRIEGHSDCKLKIGDVFKEVYHYPVGDEGIVTRIYSEECDTSDNNGFNGMPLYTYDMKIKPIIREYRVEKFNSREELWEKWPQLHPNNRFDWSKERGHFGSVGDGMFLHAFSWRMKNERYYLDEKSFNIMPASIRCEDPPSVFDNSWGYTDLIITIEAIKNKAWKLFSYVGRKFNSDLLRDFPSAKKAYGKAVWDSHTSLYAKQNNMSILDFLRYRISSKK